MVRRHPSIENSICKDRAARKKKACWGPWTELHIENLMCVFQCGYVCRVGVGKKNNVIILDRGQK